jgi:hypothetical protein
VGNNRLDNELATFTDRVLAGEEPQVSDELQNLAQVVQQLHQVIAPDASPDPAFKARLTQRLMREWVAQPARQPRRALPWYRNRMVQLGVLAAGLVVVLLAIVLLSGTPNGSDDAMQGTTWGSLGWTFMFAVLLAGVGGLWFWFRQRH